MATGIFKLRDQLYGLVQGAWSGTQKTNFVEYLVVAGGGGAGNNAAGGGGAGGLLTGIVTVAAGSSYTVTVGSGGAGSSSASVNGTNGVNSVFGSVSATGGGGGGSYNGNAGSSGGSGGGGASGQYIAGGIGGQGVSGQGNVGGIGGTCSSVNSSGGGGGAGTIGLAANGGASGYGGNGGAGIASAISGTVTTYAGGGGGGSFGAFPAGTGGVGGGGSGVLSGTGISGSTNSGGGGGGGGGGTGGTGGTGICIISYPDTYNAPTTLTGTYTASTSGSGSLYASTTDQYLLYSTNAAFGMGTGDFTVEAWIYWSGTNSSASNNWLDLRATNSASAIVIGVDLTGKPYFYDGPANAVFTSASAISSNTWYHFALARSGTTWKFFQSGVQVATTTSASNLGSSQPCYFMQGVNGSNVQFQGYVSNLRIVKGTAVYTTTFTPSATPLTAISGTSLLLNTVSGARFADSSTNSFVATVTGTPTWNQLSPFATGLGYKNRVYTWTASGTVTF